MTSPLLLNSTFEHSTTPTLDWEWSMVEYEDALSARIRRDEAAALEAWDELEKSIIANLADEVRISIRGREVEMVVYKSFGRE